MKPLSTRCTRENSSHHSFTCSVILPSLGFSLSIFSTISFDFSAGTCLYTALDSTVRFCHFPTPPSYALSRNLMKSAFPVSSSLVMSIFLSFLNLATASAQSVACTLTSAPFDLVYVYTNCLDLSML